MGIGLTDEVVPLGAFPIARDTNLLGGFRTAANQAALVATPAGRLSGGMIGRAQDDGTELEYDSGSALWVPRRFLGSGILRNPIPFVIDYNRKLVGFDSHTYSIPIDANASTELVFRAEVRDSLSLEARIEVKLRCRRAVGILTFNPSQDRTDVLTVPDWTLSVSATASTLEVTITNGTVYTANVSVTVDQDEETRTLQPAQELPLMPWDTPDLIGYWAVPPWGTITQVPGSPPTVTAIQDMQPAPTFPAGKTHGYDRVSTGSPPQYVGGFLHSPIAGPQLNLVTSDGEYLAHLAAAQAPWTCLVVRRSLGAALSTRTGWDSWGPGNMQMVSAVQMGAEMNAVLWDGVTLLQTFTGANDMAWHVVLTDTNGLAMNVADELAPVAGPINVSGVANAIIRTVDNMAVGEADVAELCIWKRDLTPTERHNNLIRAAIRWGIL